MSVKCATKQGTGFNKDKLSMDTSIYKLHVDKYWVGGFMMGPQQLQTILVIPVNL